MSKAKYFNFITFNDQVRERHKYLKMTDNNNGTGVNDSGDEGSSGLDTTVLALIIAFAVLAWIVMVIVGIYCCCKSKKKPSASSAGAGRRERSDEERIIGQATGKTGRTKSKFSRTFYYYACMQAGDAFSHICLPGFVILTSAVVLSFCGNLLLIASCCTNLKNASNLLSISFTCSVLFSTITVICDLNFV